MPVLCGNGDTYITLHDDALNHALKEVDGAAQAIAASPTKLLLH